MAGRLIFTSSGSPIQNLSAFTAHELNCCVERLDNRIKDTNSFLLKLDELNTDSRNPVDHDSVIHATWDVTDMFNSIPQYFALEQCQDHLNKRENPVINTDCVIEAIDITLKNNVPM